MSRYKQVFWEIWRPLYTMAALLLLTGLSTPLFRWQSAAAAIITSRSLQLGSAQPSTATTYTFSFVPGTAAAIQGLKFQACTTAIGACTAPTGLTFVSAAGGTVGGSWTNATNFSVDAVGANDCTASASILCAKRTQAASETTAGVRTVAFTGITNPSGASCSGNANCTFFVRVTTYSTNTWTAGSIVDSGTVASSTTQSVTLTAVIQETLTFCIGATTINDATTAPPACSAISGTSLSLGTLNSGNTSVTPVPAGSGGDANNGIAQLSTNASNGAAVGYLAIQQSGTNHAGSLRVAGATCSASSSNTDQCIDSVGTTKANLVTGTEKFGMTIAAVNCAATTAYTCSYAGGTYKLIRDTNYNATGADTYTTDSGLISGTSNAQYAWDESGALDTIATANTVVDREALILKFAATPNIVTPTGAYTAKADFVATPTF